MTWNSRYEPATGWSRPCCSQPRTISRAEWNRLGTAHRLQAARFDYRLLADRPAPHGRALALGRAAPDAVDLPCPQRERQTFAPNPAGRADRFGLRRLLQSRAGIRDRKEQIGVGRPAGGNRPPLSAGHEPRRPGFANLLPAFAGSAHQSASSTLAAARLTAVHIIQFTAPGRGGIVGAACRGIAVSYGSPGCQESEDPLPGTGKLGPRLGQHAGHLGRFPAQ
jgi:hypothetical protein